MMQRYDKIFCWAMPKSEICKLRSAKKVVCCDRELPTFGLVANGKVKKVGCKTQ